ncbi:E3 ubiquitin-protein like [Actinidia chinensis var. chinensis]|uniref:E3 ubiquitin-protein like n=1 Tax=Actinidia chinensis var. chinensis TaxID=1590841 RepID=A0A2R6RYC1_ACTCC|nr:E3 ubiquitin-protein like [Actinidia chinensis var. chinensis]
MGDYFVLPEDRLLTEFTFEAAVKSENGLQHSSPSPIEDRMNSDSDSTESSDRKLVSCRICHDEDEDSNMEMPCSCRGSLKYAHRKCVQRWCNEKGDITCEICHQQFKPGYIAPPCLFHYGGVPMNFRGNWEVSRRDLHNPQFIAMLTDRSLLDTDLDDYSSLTSRSLICCRVVAIIFMVLLVLRHTLPIIISGAGDYPITLFTSLMLRTMGILLPVYIMVKASAAIQRRRHQQEARNFSLAASDEENDMLPQLQPQQHLIHVH